VRISLFWPKNWFIIIDFPYIVGQAVKTNSNWYIRGWNFWRLFAIPVRTIKLPPSPLNLHCKGISRPGNCGQITLFPQCFVLSHGLHNSHILQGDKPRTKSTRRSRQRITENSRICILNNLTWNFHWVF